jgi:hypothetical protein
MASHERFGILPERFYFAHLFCQRLSDRLVEIHRHVVNGPFWDIRIAFDSIELAEEFSGITESAEVISWLEKHEYSEVLGKIMLNQLFVALLGDLCQFVFEALGSSARGKTAVSFALFRKPLKDNLFYLEWLLADTDEMLTAFFNEDADRFALHNVASREKALRVSREAVARLISGFELDPDFLWQLRFDKTASFGLEQFWQRASHLITHKQHVKTRPRDINFVFHDDVDRQADWEDLYSKIPVLLFYAVEICETLAVLVTGAPMPDWFPVWLHRGTGFVLWFRDSRRWQEGDSIPNFRITELDLLCRCGFIIERERLIRRFYVDEEVRCPQCGRVNTAESFVEHRREIDHDKE